MFDFKKNELSISEKINIFNSKISDNDILLKNISELFNDSINNDVIINRNVYDDLDIFKSVFNKINKTDLLYGEYTLKLWLKQPTNKISKLITRQNNIKKLLKNNNLCMTINNIINNLRGSEGDTLWFWNNQDDNINSLYEIIYFTIPMIDKYLNKNEFILNVSNIYKIFISPSTTIFIPIISFILPYILLLLFYKSISFKTFIKLIYTGLTSSFSLVQYIIPNYGGLARYISILLAGIWGLLYIQSGYNSVRLAMDTHKIINILHKKMNIIYDIYKKVKKLYKIINKKLTLDSKIMDELKYFDELFRSYNNKIQIFNNKGRILSVYRKFLDKKESLINILKYLGELDALCSLVKLYNTNNYCFAKYSKVTYPLIYIKDLWHPYLDKNAITNNVKLDMNNRNMLITGPNKAGKSTYIKSMAIAVLFSQSLGIVSASKCHIKPFKIINTYLHIPDMIGYESLFEAEMQRAADHISLLKRNIGTSFIIMDEIFTSTNYVEGYSAAYAVIKKLTKYSQSNSIITTHFTGLNEIENETNGVIKNYMFTINRDKDGNIEYVYKLRRGYSKQYIALELLKNNNFEKDVIDNALEICKKIQKNI